MARTLTVDATTAEVLRAFRGAGQRAIVLKGPSLERELHVTGRRRTYVDSDVLVPPASLDSAGAVLAGLGFELVLDHRHHGAVAEPHAQEWSRPPRDDRVDLHWRVPGVNAPDERAWDVLAAHAVPIDVGRGPGETLDRPAVALLVALHAAHHAGTEGKPLRDLERALEVLDRATWVAASDVAARLDAREAFAAGLRLAPPGAHLAAELGLPAVRSPRRLLMAGRPPPGAHGALRVLEARRGARLRAALAELLPAPALMRSTSPLARRGRAGLAIAYPARLASRAWRLPAAIRAARRSRAALAPAQRRP